MPTVSKLLNCRAPLRPRLRRLPTPGRFMGGGGPPLGAERRPSPRHRGRGIARKPRGRGFAGGFRPRRPLLRPRLRRLAPPGPPRPFPPAALRRGSLSAGGARPPKRRPSPRGSPVLRRLAVSAGCGLAPCAALACLRPPCLAARPARRRVLGRRLAASPARRLRPAPPVARPAAANPAPAPRGRPLGCALRACRFGAPPPGARGRAVRGPPVYRARASRRGFARLRRAGAQGPMLGLSPCGDYVVKGENLCTPETRRTEPALSPSGPCSEHSSGPGSTNRKHHKKF